ncbi:hypothetical protein QFZ82_007514 [Streptomyces sp. V4I23]|nr:hypothetical protein [Streptomyces sp. V4I23]
MGVPWPWPVAPREPKSSARTAAVWASRPSFFSRTANIRAARIGPTVCELEGPMPMENRSKTLIATPYSVGLEGHADRAVGMSLARVVGYRPG